MRNSTLLPSVSPEILNNWLKENRVQLIDVREAIEYREEHLMGAELIPLSQFNPESINHHPGKNIVIYCRSGNRSSQAVQKLANLGCNHVFNLEGGLPAWKAAGYPTKIHDNPPISLMRQVQIVAGSLVVTGTVLGVLVSPWFLILSGFVGSGLVFAGISNTCALGMLLAKLPYNQRLGKL